MKKAVGAVLFHCSDIADDNIRHKFCPRIVNGWCKWQHDKLTGESTYKKKLNLPLVIKTVIEPIFRDLSDEKLLSKCLHGQTQNANEAYNPIIWNRCPKTVFVNRTVLELSVFSATISFNDGFKGLRTVFSKLGFVDPGHYYLLLLRYKKTTSVYGSAIDNALMNQRREESNLGQLRRGT